jgi:hypothetical protein
LPDVPGKYHLRAILPNACYLPRPDLSHTLHRKRAWLPNNAGRHLPTADLPTANNATTHYLCRATMLPNRNRSNLRRTTLPYRGRQTLPATLNAASH